MLDVDDTVRLSGVVTTPVCGFLIPAVVTRRVRLARVRGSSTFAVLVLLVSVR